MHDLFFALICRKSEVDSASKWFPVKTRCDVSKIVDTKSALELLG